jgi:hypothetical protein
MLRKVGPSRVGAPSFHMKKETDPEPKHCIFWYYAFQAMAKGLKISDPDSYFS